MSAASHFDPLALLTEAVLKLAGNIPATDEARAAQPLQRAEAIARRAAAKAAFAAGALAIPPGPAGWLTILPEVVSVWRIQAQMVADIAAVFGQRAELHREQMLYCLFKQTAAQAVRDLVAYTGEKVLFSQPSLRTLQAVARGIGIRFSQRALGKGIARWLPIVGALGVGAYAFGDTRRVARTAIGLFSKKIESLPETPRIAAPVKTLEVASEVVPVATVEAAPNPKPPRKRAPRRTAKPSDETKPPAARKPRAKRATPRKKSAPDAAGE